MTMNKQYPATAAPQDKDDEASVDSSVASLDKDLQALSKMDIDANFNTWSSFRGSFSVQKRASLAQIGKSKRSMRIDIEKFDDSIDDIKEVEVYEDPLQKLTPAERTDINQWSIRLDSEQVFSRYYFPEQWELKEMNTIQKFLKLENPNTSSQRTVSRLLLSDIICVCLCSSSPNVTVANSCCCCTIPYA